MTAEEAEWALRWVALLLALAWLLAGVRATQVFRDHAQSLLPEAPECACGHGKMEIRHGWRYRLRRFLVMPLTGLLVLTGVVLGFYSRLLLVELAVQLGNWMVAGWIDEAAAEAHFHKVATELGVTTKS